MWGALASWHRPQGDPLVHLGNERRGCLSLPDADCCYLPVRSRGQARFPDNILVCSTFV